MQGLVFDSPVKSILNGLAHRVCEACGPYAAKHGSETLIENIQNATTEAALMELGALVCGVCSSDLMQRAVEPRQEEQRLAPKPAIEFAVPKNAPAATVVRDGSSCTTQVKKTLTEQERQLVLRVCDMIDLGMNGNVNSEADVSQMLVSIFVKLK